MYGGIHGLFPGLEVVIMCCKILMGNESMSVANLIDLFLRRFGEWNWPVLVPLQGALPDSPNAWNPTFNLNQRQDVMPIITPCFPQANTTAKVLPSVVGLFQKELEDGLKRLGGWGAFFSPREESEA